MLDKSCGVLPESVAFLLRVHFVLPCIASQRDEPNARAHEDVDVLGVLLHGGDGLDRRGAGADDGDVVVRPLLFLVVFGPGRGVHDFAFEFVFEAGDVGPLVLVQQARAVQEEIAVIFELARFLARFLFDDLDQPLAFFFLPVGSDDFGVEVHVLAEIKGLDDFLEVREDVWGLGEEFRPVWVQGEVVGVGVRRDVTGCSWVAVLEPGSGNVFVLFVDYVLDVGAVFLDLVGHEDAADAGSDAEDSEAAVLRVHPCCVLSDLVACGGTELRVVDLLGGR